DPHRAAGIRTDPTWCQPRGDRAAVAATRAAGYARLVERIPDRAERGVVARDAKRELMHVRLAENDGAGVEQRLHRGRICTRNEVAKTGRAGRIADAGDVNVVLHDERHAVQRAKMRGIATA